MWTATIHEVKKVEGNSYITILFAGDQEKFVETYPAPNNASQEWLEGIVRGRITSLEMDTSFVDSLEVGEAIEVKPAPVEPPTPVDEDLALFRKKAFTLLRLKQLADLEIIPKDAQAILQVCDEMKTLYKDGYTI